MEAARIENLNAILEQHGYGQPVLIGKGSFSKVYRIRDRAGQFWACRVSEATGRWQQECINWKEISHPLFPAYREQWTEGAYGYLIIEFWEGMDLQEFLRRRKRLSPEQAAVIVGQLTEGLQYLHERPHPFLYRDLKPENVRIRSNGKVGILDLGCLWNREQNHSVAGNYFYSAPEQFQTGENPGEESDVYAVGKLLEVMLENTAQRRWEVKQCFGRRKVLKTGKAGRRRQEAWLRRLSAMATCREREKRIPDMKTFRLLLDVRNASERVRRQALKAADFYYIRKLYYS